MNMVSSFTRELRFFLKQPAAVILILVATSLSVFSVWSGLNEVERQKETIERLLVADVKDREAALAKETDYGGAAYYSFHLTYDPPSRLAFAALGERDTSPWKHRIRMLALEAQIYESDTANAELAQSGQFDFAFMLSVLIPVLLIILLHDLRASERAAGRHDLLVATSASDSNLWCSRAFVRVILLSVGVLIPFLFGAMVSGASLLSIVSVLGIAIAQILFWSFLCLWASARSYAGPTIASGLLAIWMLSTFVVPAMSDTFIDAIIPAPEGGDIILTQRESVNDAWDLPKESTMAAFVKEHPEWAEYAEINRPFEWKWYYAFQQVGDQSVADMSKKRRAAILKRDKVAQWFALLSPSSLTERSLTGVAGTDVKAAMHYQQHVRKFHGSLREYHYPLLFKGAAYDAITLASLPRFKPLSDGK
jgi:ABC-2 type transport system permease protein